MRIIIFICLVFLVNLQVMAKSSGRDIFIEPYAFTSIGKLERNDKDEVSGSGVDLKKLGAKPKAKGFGLRMGPNFSNCFLALDGSSYHDKYSSTIYTDSDYGSDTAATEQTSMDLTALGAVFGAYLFRNKVRLWAGYNFYSNLTFKEEGTLKRYSGKGTKFGLSFSPLSFISLNVEYLNYDFDTYFQEKLPYSTTIGNTETTIGKMEYEVFLFSLGFPLSF